MKELNLCLHCGGSVIARDGLSLVPTPEPTETYFPIPHSLLADMVEQNLNRLNLHVVSQTFGVAQNGKRMFGLMQVSNGADNSEHSWVAGIRNTHDKSFPAGLCVGNGVFVCDNLAFLGEIEVGRRHTLNILRDLPLLVQDACGRLVSKWDTQDKRIEAYKGVDINNDQAAGLLMEAMDREVCLPSLVGHIWDEWKKPQHPEFEPRNVWSFFNCVTEHLKPSNGSKGTGLWQLPRRTNRLHALCDSVCGIDFSDLKQDPEKN